jgi:hypothetical protein
VAKAILTAALAGALACLAAPGALARTELATNALGDQVLLDQVLHQPSSPLFAGERAAGAGFGGLTAIAPRGVVDQSYVNVVIDSAGGAVTKWVNYTDRPRPVHRVMVSVRPPGGSFAPPTELAHKDSSSAILAGNTRGDAIVAWSTYQHPIRYSFKPAGGAFGKPVMAPGSRYFALLGVALDEDGGAVIVSSRFNRLFKREVVVSRRAPGALFGRPRPIAGVPGRASFSFATSPSGRTLLAWFSRKYSAIRAVEREPGADFGAPFEVVAIPYTSGIDDLALASSGAAALALGDTSEVRIARRAPGGRFGELSPVGPLGAGESPQVAVNERGDAAATWGGTELAVESAYLPGDAMAWRPLVLAAARPNAPGGPVLPSLVIDDTGRAAAAWEESDGATVRTFTRDFDGSGAAAATEVAALPSYRQERPAGACRPRGTRVVRSSQESTVFRRPASIYGCLFGRGAPVHLTSDNIFPRRTIALAGPLVAYGADYTEDRNFYTDLKVTDLRDEGSGINRTVSLETTRRGELAATRLRADGAVAWISCPRKRSAYGRLSRACARSGGRLKHVWALDAHADERRLLDSGRRIEPRSLRLRGTRLTWRRAGALRESEMPE